MSYTPGPWAVTKATDMQSMYSVNREAWGHKWGSSVAVASQRDTGACNPITHEEAMANARLISAAPDLLEALQKFVAWSKAENSHTGTTFLERVEMLRDLDSAASSAIAKATGEQA